MPKSITRIVLTGGPAAGKTTLISRILKEFKQEDGWRVITRNRHGSDIRLRHKAIRQLREHAGLSVFRH